ncbi:MAG TPA: ZIP family metal transporter [Gammaproteobacteria bacterium]|nr:ZIP family metal transporter [Gammaproteobacteria bacterium]
MQFDTLFWIIPFTLLGGVLSALTASILLLFPERVRTALLPRLVSFAIGALLGAAFLDLLPEAFRSSGAAQAGGVGLALALGVLGFFLLEKLAFWHHGHETHAGEGHHEHLRRQAAGTLIVIGTGLHNFLDGILLGATFLSSIHLGVVLAVAVIAHQIPQQVGDISVLLVAGVRRRRALLLSALSGATMVIGGVLAWAFLDHAQALLPYVLAVAAASLIYIAVADLIPGVHRHEGARLSLLTLVLIAAGIGLIYLLQNLIAA